MMEPASAVISGQNLSGENLPPPSAWAGGEDIHLLTPDLGEYWSLLKPRVMSLVVFSGFAGLMVAPGHLHPILAFTAILAIALASGGAGAINMWYDRDIDAKMQRTQRRAIPMGKIAPQSALIFGTAITVASVALMGLAVNWMAAGLLAFAAGF